ncbi:MAG: hypothetical protein P8K82_00420 [Paracoccaceae bacterium]|nr:hypothetical protein [Paracoccaceae bacterium]
MQARTGNYGWLSASIFQITVMWLISDAAPAGFGVRQLIPIPKAYRSPCSTAPRPCSCLLRAVALMRYAYALSPAGSGAGPG